MPFDGARVLDSDEVLDIKTLPRTLTVIGGGVIGVEYATIFSALDVPVTLIEPRDTILDFIDRELVDDFVHQMRDRGMAIRLGCSVDKITAGAGGVETRLSDGRTVRTDMLLYAAGRNGNVDRLGLDAVGIETDSRGRIKVDPLTFQTSAPNIYAAGDVIGFPSLASTSMEQGRIAACHAFGEPLPPAPEAFPYGIYAVPEISTVGQTEEEVRKSGVAYECGVARFRETSRGHIMGVNSGFLKLIFALDSRRLLGAHIVGEGRDRTGAYRAGGDQPEGHGRLLRREHLQLPDAGGGLQDRGAGRLEPDAGLTLAGREPARPTGEPVAAPKDHIAVAMCQSGL